MVFLSLPSYVEDITAEEFADVVSHRYGLTTSSIGSAASTDFVSLLKSPFLLHANTFCRAMFLTVGT